MELIQITVPGEPIAKPRAKGWFNKKTNILHHYYDSASGIKPFEQHVKDLSFEKFKTPLDGPVRLDVVFIFPRPKAMMWKTKPMPREYKTTRPDYDNLMKSISDAMNGIVFRDDGQVVSGSWAKFVAAGDEVPRTEITISYQLP